PGATWRGVVIVFRDITAERRAEAELRASQARFARLAESGIVGIVIADAGGRFVEVNDAFARMVGSTRAEPLAGPSSWADLAEPAGIAAARARLRRADRAGAPAQGRRDRPGPRRRRRARPRDRRHRGRRARAARARARRGGAARDRGAAARVAEAAGGRPPRQRHR